MNWVQSLLVGVGVLVVGWLAKQGWNALPSWWGGRREAKKKRKESEARRDRRTQIDGLRRRIRDAAEASEMDLPWSEDPEWRGPGKCIIFTSGDRSYYIDAYEHGIGQYRAAIQSGKVPPQRTFPKPAPKPVTRWTKSELETWLDNHREG